MKVFVQNEAGSSIKHIHNEKTLELKETTRVSRPYPLPYGFVLNTTGEDGMNVDCFIVTNRPLNTGKIIECDPVALMEQMENGKQDHNIIAVIEGESRVLDDYTKQILTDFVNHVFDHIAGNEILVGAFLSREAALSYIEDHID